MVVVLHFLGYLGRQSGGSEGSRAFWGVAFSGVDGKGIGRNWTALGDGKAKELSGRRERRGEKRRAGKKKIPTPTYLPNHDHIYLYQIFKPKPN